MKKLPPGERERRRKVYEKERRTSVVRTPHRKAYMDAYMRKYRDDNKAWIILMESRRTAVRQHGGLPVAAGLSDEEGIALVQSWLDRKPPGCEFCGRLGCKLLLDHNHKTGRIRAWLCHQCNTLEGYIATGRVDRMRSFIASRESDE